MAEAAKNLVDAVDHLMTFLNIPPDTADPELYAKAEEWVETSGDAVKDLLDPLEDSTVKNAEQRTDSTYGVEERRAKEVGSRELGEAMGIAGLPPAEASALCDYIVWTSPLPLATVALFKLAAHICRNVAAPTAAEAGRHQGTPHQPGNEPVPGLTLWQTKLHADNPFAGAAIKIDGVFAGAITGFGGIVEGSCFSDKDDTPYVGNNPKHDPAALKAFAAQVRASRAPSAPARQEMGIPVDADEVFGKNLAVIPALSAPAPAVQAEPADASPVVARVPYTAGTWPKGVVWIRGRSWSATEQAMVVHVCESGVMYLIGYSIHTSTFAELADGKSLSTDGGLTWSPCTLPGSKAVG